MEPYLQSLSGKGEDEPPPMAAGRKRQPMSFNARDYSWRLLGVGLFRVQGSSPD